MADDGFEGSVTIEWSRTENGVLPGWRFAVRSEDGSLITTVTELAIHATATDLTVVDLVMFADDDGRPLLTAGPALKPGPDGDEIRTGTFRFLVADMRVAEPQS